MNMQFLHKGVLLARKASPTALMVGGIVGAVTAAVMVGRATPKAMAVTEAHKHTTDLIKELAETHPDKTDRGAELTKMCVHTGVQYVKIYAPAVVVGALSIAAISGGHVIMLKRNAALAATLTLAEKAFATYRKTVAGEIGDEREREIYFGREIEQVHDTQAGTVTDVVHIDLNKHSQYARFFDETNPNWERNADYNKMFVEAQQRYANHKLTAKGYLLLNDVYESLGMPRTSAGAVVGWVVNNGGDNYVDFGMYDPSDERKKAFLAGEERSIILDFNVDGVVYQLIGE